MLLKSISIRNFRNIKEINYCPKENLNVILGDNAQGKTNLLEALYLPATGSSFRTAKNSDLIKYNENKLTIYSTYFYNSKLNKSLFEYQKDGKKVWKINNKKTYHNDKENLRIVVFTPDDLFLVKGSPDKRRYFIDFILRQISPEYRYNFSNYTKILKKRNQLLKSEKIHLRTFNIIEDIFIETAANVILARLNLINILDSLTTAIFKKINKSEIKLKYALSFPIENNRVNLSILKDKLKKQVKREKEKEKAVKRSLIGPHLDDIHIYLDNRMARLFASQGQQRNIVISLKIAEVYTIKKIFHFYPIFLLDEVLSELDDGKKGLLIDFLEAAEFQSFLTAVNYNGKENKNRVLVMKDGCLQ